METAVATAAGGAFDFLTKPFEMEQVVIAVERAAQHKSLREEVKRLRGATEESTALQGAQSRDWPGR